MTRRRIEPIRVDRIVVDAIHLDMVRSHGPTLAAFHELNGCASRPTEAEVVTLMLQLSAGELSKTALAVWLGDHLKPRS